VQPSSSRVARHSSRGAALIMALLFAAVLGIAMIALSATRINELRSVSRNVQLTRAQLIAEAGVDAILGAIVQDRGILPVNTPILETTTIYTRNDTFADGEYKATATIGEFNPQTTDGKKKIGPITIVSTGEDATGARFTVEVLVEVRLKGSNINDVALLGCGDIFLTGTANVRDGRVYAGQNLTISGKGAVDSTGTIGASLGEATARRNISFQGEKGFVRGNVKSTQGDILSAPGARVGGVIGVPESGIVLNPLPLITLDAEKGHLVDGAVVRRGDPELPDYCGTLRDDYVITASDFAEYQAISDFPDPPSQVINSPADYANGILYVDGDLQVNVSGTVGARLFIVVKGKLTFGGSGSLTNHENVFIADGDITLAGGQGPTGAVMNGFFYTNGEVTAVGSRKINGSVLAMSEEKAVSAGFWGVTYAETRTDLRIRRIEALEIVRWRLINNPL
jgi:hypothetical protein